MVIMSGEWLLCMPTRLCSPLFLTTCLLCLCMALPISTLQLPVEDFHCGSGQELRKTAYNEIMQNCPGYLVQLSHCCAKHDDCYGQRKSQEFCDEEYAKCNQRVMRVADRGVTWCRSKIELISVSMPLLGYIAYSRSNYSDPSKNDNLHIRHLPLLTPRIELHYQQLYSACPFVNITLSSCAWMFNDCLSSSLITSVCSRQISQCIFDASEQQNTSHCLRTAESMSAHLMAASEVIDSGYMSQLRRGFHSTWVIILLGLVAFLLFVLVLLKLWGYISVPVSDDSNSIKKYAPIQVECCNA